MGVKGFKLYFILISIIFLCPLAYCDEFNMNSYSSATINGTMNRYHGFENYEYGSGNTYTFGTRYNGRLGEIETYFHYPVVEGLTYRFTYNMDTSDFRNHLGSSYYWDCDHEMTNTNAVVVMPVYVSMKKVQVSIIPREDTTCIRISLRSTDVNNVSITGVSNWKLNNITIYDPEWQSGSGSGQGTATPSPTPSGATNQDVINSQNNNTNDIINNQNDNTSNIIENNNENTSKIIDSNDLAEVNSQRNNFDTSNLDCGLFYKYNLSKGKGFYTNGNEYINEDMYYTEDFIPLNSATKLVLDNFNNTNNGNIIIYDNLKNYLDYWGVRNQTINLPSNAYYFRYSTTLPLGRVFKDKGCTSKLDSITSDSVDSGTGTSFFNDFTTTDNGGISAIVTKPLTIINNLLTNNNQCANLALPEFLGVSNAYLPSGCILWINASETMVSIWNIFVCGFASYYILKDLFKIVENLKNPDNDKVEVIDL